MANTDGKGKSFEKYWDENDVKTGLESGTLFEGVVRINPKNYKEAYVTAPNERDPDILIDGILHRNRALNGDNVVYILISEEKEVSASQVESKSGKKITSNCPQHAQNHKGENAGKKNRNAGKNEKSYSCQPLQETKLKPKEKANGSNVEGRKVHPFAAVTAAVTCSSEGTSLIATELETVTEALKGTALNIPSPEKTSDCAEGKKKKHRRSRKKGKKTIDSTDCSTNNDAIPDPKSHNSFMGPVETPVPSDPKTCRVTNSGKVDTTQVPRTDIPPAENVEDKCTSESSNRKKAKVVFIKEYKHSRRAIGHLKKWPYGQSSPEPKWLLFSPKDHRIPRIKIPYNLELANCTSQVNMLYLAQIISWDDVNHPFGSLCYCVGKSGDLEAETIALLLEHEVDYNPFSSEVLNTLPQLPWSIPEEEMKKRRDFRDDCIFTIDPSDARDLDDAVCGRFLKLDEDGATKLFEISVHIADVSFFIDENSTLDEIAGNRATSTYLVDRVIPMLPHVLCEHVCSLNPGEDRLAFSVEWIINEKGEIVREWFGRSVIRSCAKLSYDHAQAVIEGRSDVNWPDIQKPFSLNDVQKSIEVLQSVAIALRQKRISQGALRIDLPRLTFSMDWATRTPTGFRLYELKDSNRLIEEFMLLANMRVAEKIYSAFPEISVLRCHPPPNEMKLSQVAETLQAVGIHLDVSSSAALQNSLLHYGQTDSDPVSLGRNLVISNLLAKPMKCAMYICSGMTKSEMNFRHFALSVPFYTHFTSPIRRYPDILVHRLLSAALNESPMDHWNRNIVKKLLENCNSRKLSSKAIQELHSELHLSALIRKTGPIEIKGIVLSVLDRAVDVVFLYIGLVRRLYLEKLPLDELSFHHDNGIGTLTLTWSASNGERPVRQCISVFSVLEIVLVPHEKGDLQFGLVLQRPTSCSAQLPPRLEPN